MVAHLALDTNAHRAFTEGNASIAKFIFEAADLGLPIVVLGELYHGIYNGSRTKEGLQKLRKFLAIPRLTILNINSDTAKLFGEISTQLKRDGRPMQQNDVWIAALCKQYGFTLATADRGFENCTGLEVQQF